MKLRNKITILTAMLFLAIISVKTQTTSGLEISNPQFIYDINSRFNFRSANSTSSNRAPFTAEVVQEISALFRNTGSESIKRVSQEFIIYKDVTRTKIQHIYTLKNKTEILPGDEVRLSKAGRFWGNSQYPEVKVFRIEYANGTIWEGAKTKN